MNRPMDLEPRIASVLSAAGIHDAIDAIEAMSPGGNNRSYRVTVGARTFLVKQYFSHAGDARDRLGSEYAFLLYANRVAPGWTPAALVADRDARMALYEFVAGRHFRPDEVTADHVDAAARFFVALNQQAQRSHADLPVASEACFSIDEHLALIDERLKRLHALDQQVPEDRDARTLIEAIVARWQAMKSDIRLGAAAVELDPATPLEPDRRCISPSDFGFHNALVESDGRIRFLDFEYAGWDDPAKMAGDFFAQLAVPVPAEFFDRFVEACLAPFSTAAQLGTRARLLRGAYQIKWCCIALNVFLPVHLARRKFANPGLDERALKQSQLAKANNLFQSILVTDYGLH